MTTEPEDFSPCEETILRIRVGSGLHGISIADQDDDDQMGIYVPPQHYVMGLDTYEHHIVRTQPEGVRSGPGDLDLTLYSLKKYIGLAAKGNPSILTMLFAPTKDILFSTALGRRIIEDRMIFLSQEAGERHLGYMMAQKERFLNLRGGRHTNRPELIEKYGFDTKYAGHMIRLALQGIELMNTGNITLPMPEQDSKWIRELRQGGYSKQEATARAESLEAELRDAIDTTHLPPRPDHYMVNNLLVQIHQSYWGGRVMGANYE